MNIDEELRDVLIDFMAINDHFSRASKEILAKLKSDIDEDEKNKQLLYYLSTRMLLDPLYFDDIFEKFSKYLPRLLQIALFSNMKDCTDKQHHILCTILLGRIISRRKDLKGYAMKYFTKYPAVLESLDTSENISKKCKLVEIVYDVLYFIESCYHLLKSDPNFYRYKWNWSIFVQKFLDSEDDRLKWVSCHIVSILFGMNEIQKKQLILKHNLSTADIKFTTIFNLKGTLIDCSTQPIHTKLIWNLPDEFTDDLINISGIYVPVVSKVSNLSTNLIEVPSTLNNLRKVALGLTLNKAICLQGPVGSGKTTLVEYFAEKTGRNLGENFVKVQLGDQTDSKMLLGTYRCTDVPGEFVWQPGVLTQAVLEGNWLLLEDIDSASMDIASMLTSLLENNSLTVPGYRDSLQISPGFQLFVTHRFVSTITGHHKKHTNTMTLLEKHLLQINVDPLSMVELKQIIDTKYPDFCTISDRLVKVFLLFTEDMLDPSKITLPKSGRLISTRDFFKWCSRAIQDFDVTSQASALKVLQDAIDVFCCSYPNQEDALNLAKQISTHLGIVNHKADYFFKEYKPTMQLTPDHFIAGRVALPRNNKELMKLMKYSFTRQSSVLLERIMCCVNLKEPVLLVGETGTGKTSCVQYLAHTVGQKLVVINMNQQSDSADLLGGFKPVDLKFIVSPIKREFEQLFCSYFKVEPNKKYLSNLTLCFNNQRWSDLIKLMIISYQAAERRLTKAIHDFDLMTDDKTDEKIVKNQKDKSLLNKWHAVGEKLNKLGIQLKHTNALAFAFIEGSLVNAVENGYWVLLDEINLANAETLECLSGLLEGSQGSLCLLERGDKKPIKRHPNFTLFACMNPSTDVGKKDLPAGLRNRFTEFFVDELNEKNDLFLLVNNYLEAMSINQKLLENIVNFYLQVKKETATSLLDGVGHKPHYSLRSLCRALVIASKNPCGMFKRSLYEAFCLSFLTQLDNNSYVMVEKLISSYLIGDAKSVKAVLNQPITDPSSSQEKYLQFEGYWVKKGHLEPSTPDDYILTASVRKNLKDLVRVVSIGKLPVLLQGDTSVGKTSLITYLAKSSGNKCVRINNHEHTDLQEYIGSYIADLEGKLVFREGLLVEAMRNGHWIILDELNLAPTDVLEALNRVLDDNRELFIPETQETVKADPNFMLFATQNPPGAYGGRKMLSRAFRNRFVELHFNEIPPKELEFILHQRCQMAPSYAKKMINVMTDLQIRRRGSAAFAGKRGFITLRDLFRWGERYRLAQNSEKLYDWDQHLADEGYLVLAGKVRRVEEKSEIISVLQRHLKREVDPEHLFTLSDRTSTVTRHILKKIEDNRSKYNNIVWTFNMRQLAVLVSKALDFKEPVLLVGETGGGKTTVCKLIAENNGQELVTVNCHMHTESSDFIGGLRPVRDHTSENSTKLFEWVDGPLISAMLRGNVFLADEISLADDSVLERLNSLLEPERTLLLAEKGIDINNRENSELIVATSNFFFIGTMNPGGDFGKKELSPALRNRFTEIWCESCKNRQDLIDIIEQNIIPGISLGNQQDGSSGIGICIMDFIQWFEITEVGKRFTISIRDILTWVNFINTCVNKMDVAEAYLHGACLTFLDSLGSGITSTESLRSLDQFKEKCLQFLSNQIIDVSYTSFELKNLKVEKIDTRFGIKPFYIETNQEEMTTTEFSFNAPTTVYNTLRLLRGMQLNKAILLEGSPGVGKTSLVTALANFTGHKLFRINLSDQTDISDLFGADLPVEGGTGGQFSWRDGPLLEALKSGSWILLDELNLASQSVLEGLNACLDHRGEIFIPELGKTFYVKSGTRFFGCQNPLKQGGSRRGLPQSFLNRFIQVFVRSLTDKDLFLILMNQFNQLPVELLRKMVDFNTRIVEELDNHTFANKGSPWECNLRDLTRWCEATIYCGKYDDEYRPRNVVLLIYGDRMRTLTDKNKVESIFNDVFGQKVTGAGALTYVSDDKVYFGDVFIERNRFSVDTNVLKQEKTCLVLRSQMKVLRSLAYCVNLNWMAILVGTAGSGKSSVVKTLASLAGKTLKTLPVTSAMDTTDILGGFEQTDYSRHLDEIVQELEEICLAVIQTFLTNEKNIDALRLMQHWEAYRKISDSRTHSMDEEIQLFMKKINKIEEIVQYLPSNSRVNKIQQRLEKIYKAIKTEGSLNAGGKFEWVDSVLIKCLQDGSWLLIDNVNLCSSAVLDRLNALLEPNGVLTVSERGVDSTGQMIEIKPHKDFRLFLAMDPKHGEISRAMRNRGIEIYMLNDAEYQDSNNIDKSSLIQLEGLDSADATTLIELHDYISELIIGEKPNINELIQVSTLAAQQIKNGLKRSEAFAKTIIEIYFKTRSANEFSCNDFPQVIREKIDKLINVDVERNIPANFNRNSTLRTQEISTNSAMEKIKQQGVLLFDRFENGVKISDINQEMYYLLLCFYSITSLEDLNFRHFYLIERIKCEDVINLEAKDILINTITVLYESILDSETSVSLPLDHNWTPEIFREESILRSNRNNLRLLFSLYNFRDNAQLTKHGIIRLERNRPIVEKVKRGRIKKVTLYEYACLVKNNLVEDHFNDIIIRNIVELIIEYEHLLKRILSDCDNFYNKDVIKIKFALFWKSKFYELFKLETDMDKKQLRKLFIDLPVHYKWFYKFAILALTEITNVSIHDELRNILIIINSKLDKQFSIMHKLGKRFQKYNKRPPPFTNREQYEIVKEYNELYQQYNPSLKGNDIVQIFNNLKQKNSLRNYLIELKAELTYDFKDIHEKRCLLSDIKKQIDSEPSRCYTRFEVQLLPMLDILAHLEVRKSFQLNDCTTLINNIVVPTDLSATMVLYHKSKDERFLHQIHKSYYLYLMHSPSVAMGKFLGTADTELNEFSAKLTYYLTNLLIGDKDEENMGKVTLGNFRDSMKQLDTLTRILWANLYQLSEEYDFILLEKQNITAIYKKFLLEFTHSLKLEMEIEDNESPQYLTELIITHIKKLQHEINNIELLTLSKKLKDCLNHFEKINEASAFEDIVINISSCYQIISFLKALFNSKLSTIDPLTKKTLKCNYYSEALEMLKILKACYDNLNSIYSNRKETRHANCEYIEEELIILKEKFDELSKYVAYRPDNIFYDQVSETINHAFSTIFSEDFVIEVNDTNREVLIKERSNKVASYENLIHGLSEFRNSFPDIVEPLLCNISEYLYGYKLYLSAIKMQEAKAKQLYALMQYDIASLVKFPCDNQKCNLSFMNKVVKYFLNEDGQQYIQEQENFRLLKCNIIDSINSAIIHSQPLNILSKSYFSEFNDLLKLFVDAYNKQQVENEIKKKEEESLYKIKIKCDEQSEEQQIREELDILFPNYYKKDFADFQGTSDLENTYDIQTEANYDEVISYKDLKDITEFHVKLLSSYTKSEWLNPTENKLPSPDFIFPLLERFKTFSKILEKSMDSLNYKMDENLIGSLSVLLAIKKRYGDIEDLTNEKNFKKKIDFYKDSNVEEVKSCYHILEDLKVKINQLLEEWPDQPTLNMIIVVIDRIYNFEITSPISRFLTGFEILLSKCHEWEEVAHSGVSLSGFTQNVTNQIIVWRKMELSLWKNVLDRVYENSNESMPKWWLHLYNVMYQFIKEKKFGAKELIETLQAFIMKSNLGEFRGRLDLLYTFHCHALHLERTEETKTFSSILWNIFIYFQQFSEVVAKKIKDLRSPIEKRVKEYVKIIRWKDVNYWAIKDAAEKSHKNLHKFMREFQAVLEQPASSCLQNISTESSSQMAGIWDKPQTVYYTTLDSELNEYLIASSQFKETKSPKTVANKSISNLHKQTVKIQKYSKEIIEATPYPELVRILDNFVREIIDSSYRLQNLEIDTTLPKEKQKSQAKNILQQKHRALATLFKNLSKIGLSFKTGIVDGKVKDPTYDFVIKPIDLRSQFSHKSYGFKEEKMLSFWESSEKYYVKSLMRLDVLVTALNNSAKELGIQNIERVRGFGQEALTTVQKQKQMLIESSRTYYYLRSYFKQIEEFCSGQEYLPSVIVDKIIDVLKYITKIINQYQIILNTCPEETSFNLEKLEIYVLKPNLEKRIIHKKDEMWSMAETRIILIKKTCDELILQFLNLNSILPSTEYDICRTKYVPVPKINQVNKALRDLKECVNDLKQIFGHIEITKTLNVIQKEVDAIIKIIHESKSFENFFDISVNHNFDKEIEIFSNKIIDILKKLRKKYKTDMDKSRSDETNEDELKEEHLNKLLIDNLFSDVMDLDMKTVLEHTDRVVSCLMTSPLETLESRKSLTIEFLPIMEQTVLLYQYFVTQQVSCYRMSCKMASIILNIFIELASKGFCIPPEFSDELDKEGITKPSDGLGLGEGQGERDVSDKIESEDQLDDAQPAGKEKDAEEDKDCKEEEKGIEMSEDFDSKLQDREKKEDDSESDSGDSDAEEQMGETDKGADQQNTETFGDEQEQELGEEEGEGGDEKEEKGDKGEKEGEEQLRANEGKTSKDEEDKSQGKDEKENSKKEINEMEEPEYDDEQVDPHHGQQQELPEPEPMDLPEDMQLDDGDANNEDDQNQDDNPFDIDTMKTEDDKPEEKPNENAEELKDDDSKRDAEEEFSSDDEDVERTDNKDAEDKEDEKNDNSENFEESEKPSQEDGETNEANGDESVLDQTQSNQENIEAMEVDDAQAVDKAQANKSENQQSNQPIEELQQDNRPDQEGTGQSQKEENSSGHTAQTTAPLEMNISKDNRDKVEQKRKQKPGETDSRRSLGDVDEPVKKKLKTVDTQNEGHRNDTEENPEENAEMYQHINDAEKTKIQVLDVATKEQAENQKKETTHEDNKDDEPTESSAHLPEEELDSEIIDVDDTITEKPETVGETKDKKNKKEQHPQGEVLEELQDIEIEGELVKTSTVPRSSESSHHTQHLTLRDTTALRLSADEVNSFRIDVEKQLSGWNEPPSTLEADQAWQKISSVTSSLAQDLSEQLRLVLEPTQASRLKGDFRTGKRINMRKVIPYIASQFRKDKIWLRRTKPSKREYQIVLAIDDSSSMADNHSKELAFESVALISKALTLLESGQLSVLGFGENVEVIHKLTDPFTNNSGIKLLQKFKFDQNKTCVAKLVDFATEMFNQSQLQSNALNAKLLIIVSDGRGVFSEGERFVQQAVRRAKLSNIFMVFVIIDNPENKNSVLDIRMPIFKDGKLQEIQSYMDAFPFSFYIILRDINSLPSVLSDALRQWFEIVSNLDKL
ncbi:midasin [Diorhabda carinulata]|uniref:midasin n=1 Tax=Diorhabda carinulata TaxID=1163345 RepID=UPI0025A14935|nr:midasin [Diorhabda carinulata]